MSFLGQYECTIGGHNKFWRLDEVRDGEYQSTYGKIGSTGKNGPIMNGAKARHIVKTKIAKGYIFVPDESPDERGGFGGKKREARNLNLAEEFEPETCVAGSLERIKAAMEKKVKKIDKVKVHHDHLKKYKDGGVELATPSRCEGKLPNKFTKNHIAEEKLDGSRYVLYCNSNPYDRDTFNKSALLSRRASTSDSKLIDKSANVPHITGLDWTNCNGHDLTGTVLDGEIYHSSGEFLKVNSIMNSSPAKAVLKQNDEDILEYKVFDIMFFKGKDIRGRSWSERRKILEFVVSLIESDYIGLPKTVTDFNKFTEFYSEIVDNGGEGLIIKDIRSGYGIGWSKMKKSYDVSCIITGMKEGTGKNASTFGSLAISVYDDDNELVEIGFVSIQEDKLRQEIYDNFDKYEGRVIDIFAQEYNKKSRRVRHPSFYRLRDDLNMQECTFERLQDSMSKSSKFSRSK